MDFPVDEAALKNLKHALDGSYVINDDGEPEIVGADFSLTRLLEFYSAYDAKRLIETELELDEWSPPIYEYPDAVFSLQDVVRALIEEIERLRYAPTTPQN